MGFVLSLLGILGTGGLLCPIGLVVSLVAIGRGGPGRGFAIAGIVLGAVGSCGGILAFVLAGGLILAALGLTAAAIVLAEPELVDLTTDMIALAARISDYQSENRYLPASLSDLGTDTPLLTDPWGNPYEYRLTTDKRGFDLVSLGEDGKPGTDDDILLSRLGESWAKAGNIRVSSSTSAGTGTVSVTIGNRTLEVRGGDDAGVVEIDLGDRVLQIKADDDGGSIEVIQKGGTPATATESPDSGPPEA